MIRARISLGVLINCKGVLASGEGAVGCDVAAFSASGEAAMAVGAMGASVGDSTAMMKMVEML